METENMNGMKNFAREFAEFVSELRDAMPEAEMENENIVTLYAIYLKNGRAEKMNGNGYNGGYKKKSDPNAPATDRQKNAIAAFARKGKIAEVDTSNLTKREASKILDEAFGKGRDSPSSFSLPKLYETENVPVEEKMAYQNRAI
jgi:hypothetical protein